MQELNLDQLIGAINSGLMKSAEDSESDKDEGEKELPAFLKKDGDKDKKKSKDESKDDKDSDEDDCEDEKKEDEGQTKKAATSGAALYREVMEKISTTNLGNGMNKQASTAGAALARALMAKQASVGDMTTVDGIAPGSTPNKNQVDNAAFEAEDAAKIKPLPAGGGSVNEIFDAMIADTLAQGAASTDQVNETGVAAQEGNVEDHAVPNQVKVAAMNELLESGMDFDQAAEIVKEASIAGMATRVGRNVSVAAGRVGQKASAGAAAAKGRASAGWAAAKGAAKGAAIDAKDAGKVLINPKNSPLPGVTRMDAAKHLAGNRLIQGGAAALAAGGAGAYALGREKKAEDELEKAAAVSELVSQGLDFEHATDLVKQAAEEIEFEMEKSAALDALLADGVDFDSAVELIKEASAGDMTTEDGIAPGSVPNKNQVDNAAFAAEGASTIKPLPGGGGNVNQIFDAIVADTLGQGAASTDQVHETGVAAQEGNVEDHAVPNQVKVATMNELLESGMDFDEASEIVKQASIASMAGRVKAMAGSVGQRASAGMAAAKGKASAGWAAAKGAAMDAKDAGKVLINPKNSPLPGVTRMDAAKHLAGNRLVQGGAAALAAGGAGAYALGREKKAAVDALCDAGVEFDRAVSLVNEKAIELYGE